MTQEERDMLLYKPQNAHNALSAAEEAEMNAYCEDYKRFLDASKTERECVFSAIELAEKRGFVEYKRGMALNPGDKVYYNNRGHHAGRHRFGVSGKGREHRRGAHRRTETGHQAPPTFPGIPC